MKTSAAEVLAVSCLLAILGTSTDAAVTFTVTPSAISNTYTGPITLLVSNLTAGDTVVVQKYLDTDTNGIVDAPDLLVEQFNLTDGQSGMVIGGVTNINVPGDTDTTAGQITARLNFPDRNFVQNLVGKYLFVLSSPTGHFSPITNSFSVTNFPFAQTITGSVFSNTTPVPDAIIILFPSSNGHDLGTPGAGTVANNAGTYSIHVPPGTYVALAVKSNYIANYSISPIVTLNSGQNTNVNLTLTNSTASISGRLVDAGNSSFGLPGIFLPAKGTNSAGNNLIAISFTDTNGNFNIRVGSGTWGLSGDASGSLNVLGYVGYDNSTNISAGTTSVTLKVPKATALFYGTVKDNLGNPLTGVAIFSSDSNGTYGNDGMSDANGDYIATAIGGLSGDPWQVEEDFGGPANYIYSQGQNGITLGTGQAYHYNFTGILATNKISGKVQFNSNPVVGVGVDAGATINSLNYNSYVDTDTNGNYSLNVANGSWNVGVNCSGGSDSLDNLLGVGTYQCPNSQSVTIANNNQTANFIIQPSGNPVGQIYGYVTDPNANPIVGAALYANDGVGHNYGPVLTDGNGYYSLNNVVNGSFDVSVDCGSLNSLGYQCVSDDQITVSQNSVEADFIAAPIQIFGFVLDTLGRPVAGVDVSANDGIGDIFSATTDGTGYYAIAVSNGTWNVSVNCGQLNSLGYECPTNESVTVSGYSMTALFTVQSPTAPTFPISVLHGFSVTTTNAGSSYTNTDGANPNAGLILSGNTLYGTASAGGPNGNGTVFAVNTNISSFTVVHTFTALDAATRTTNGDGANPDASLVLSGNLLYGTATYGGTGGNGTVFAVGTSGTGFRTLHTFAAGTSNAFGLFTNTDGANPQAALVPAGNLLYGTAAFDDTNGAGTVFTLNTNITGFADLHAFSAPATNSYGTFTNTDGGVPEATLILASNLLYGTTVYGGVNGNGTVFTVNTNGTGLSVVHTFTSLDPTDNTNSDGANPYAGLVLSGNTLYGTTAYGGNTGNGTVFAVNTDGSGFTILHHFTGGSDGANPFAGLMISGNTLYGAAAYGGTAGDGTVFALATNGTNFTVLHSFTGGSEGAFPYGSLILAGNTLYGTTSGGGSGGNGTVFALSTSPVSPLPAAPRIYSPTRLPGGQFQMLLNGVSNQNYTLEMSTNLSTSNWVTLYITNNPATNSFLLTDPNATNKQRFYRILVGP